MEKSQEEIKEEDGEEDEEEEEMELLKFESEISNNSIGQKVGFHGKGFDVEMLRIRKKSEENDDNA